MQANTNVTTSFKEYSNQFHLLKVQNSELKQLISWKSFKFCKVQNVVYYTFYGMQDRLRSIYNYIMSHCGSTGWREITTTDNKKQLQWHFEQPIDIAEQQLAAFEQWVLNNPDLHDFKRDMQFYATPLAVGRELLNWGNLDWQKYQKTTWLEPSAGHGNLIDVVLERIPKAKIHACELDATHRVLLESKYKGLKMIGHNFLQTPVYNQYDLIVGNPPFSTYSYERGDDIRHVQKMFEALKPGGVCLAIASSTWHRHEHLDMNQRFKQFLERNGTYKILEKGHFAESGTLSSVSFIKLQK